MLSLTRSHQIEQAGIRTGKSLARNMEMSERMMVTQRAAKELGLKRTDERRIFFEGVGIGRAERAIAEGKKAERIY
jgi:hypothetical protein